MLIFEVNPIVIGDDVLAQPQISAPNSQRRKRKRENVIDVLGRQPRKRKSELDEERESLDGLEKLVKALERELREKRREVWKQKEKVNKLATSRIFLGAQSGRQE